MDSFEINKIVAAVLMVALLIIGIGKLSNVIFHVEKPKTPGYAVEVEADLILLVAQRRTTSGKAYQSMWKKKLDIDIIFVNILDHYTKNQI